MNWWRSPIGKNYKVFWLVSSSQGRITTGLSLRPHKSSDFAGPILTRLISKLSTLEQTSMSPRCTLTNIGQTKERIPLLFRMFLLVVQTRQRCTTPSNAMDAMLNYPPCPS